MVVIRMVVIFLHLRSFLVTCMSFSIALQPCVSYPRTAAQAENPSFAIAPAVTLAVLVGEWWLCFRLIAKREGCTTNTGLQVFLKVAASTFGVLRFSQQLDQYGKEIWGWGIPIFDRNLPWL